VPHCLKANFLTPPSRCAVPGFDCAVKFCFLAHNLEIISTKATEITTRAILAMAMAMAMAIVVFCVTVRGVAGCGLRVGRFFFESG